MNYFRELASEMGLDEAIEEMDANRYIVDSRVHCIAVVDTQHPSYPSGQGLHEEYPEVVAYWGIRNPVIDRIAQHCAKAFNESV